MSDHETIAALRVFGGDFDRQLAELAARADEHNLDRIKRAFADEWNRAAELAQLAKASRLQPTTAR